MEFLNVGNVLDNLNMKDSMIGAEFGCGSAIFALALAKRLRKGRVYALDIQEQKLSAVKGRAMIEKVTNIMPILCDLERERGSTLHGDGIDVVLIPNLLFQVRDKRAILIEAARILKSGGEMLVIDWLKDGPRPGGARLASPFGEAAGISMVEPEHLKNVAKEAGFSLKKEFAVGDYHYGLLFVK